jgi:23S rRNA pseudouridine1911/1915/1917 synthase
MTDDFEHEGIAGEALDVIIPGALEDVRVDRALSILTGLSRSEAAAILDSGAVTLDGKVVVKASISLSAGQHLTAMLPAPDSGEVAADESVQVDVELEDADFIIVNKAPNQVVHPGAGQREGTLVAGVLARYPEIMELSRMGLCDPIRPGVVHRLDKGTSGILSFARTPEGFESLWEQLADRSMERIYIGMVEGHVVEERGVVDAPIGRSSRTPTMMSVRSDGRPARTHYEVLARIDKPHAMSLLRLQLDTGRTHQIRVHLSTIGHPIVNDARYGHRRERRLAEDRFFLHSQSLAFAHPRTGEQVSTQVALPEDIALLVPDGIDF